MRQAAENKENAAPSTSINITIIIAIPTRLVPEMHQLIEEERAIRGEVSGVTGAWWSEAVEPGAAGDVHASSTCSRRATETEDKPNTEKTLGDEANRANRANREKGGGCSRDKRQREGKQG